MSSPAMTREQLIDRLCHIFQATKDHNWNGYDAYPASAASFAWTRLFVLAIPEDVLAYTEASAVPDGDLVIEWYRDGSHILTVVIQGNATVEWAAFFNEENEYGHLVFNGKDMPEILLKWTRKICEYN